MSEQSTEELAAALVSAWVEYSTGRAPSDRQMKDALHAVLDRLEALDKALLNQLSVEPQDPGHVHTRAVTAQSREVLGIGKMPIGLAQARRAALGEKP